MKMISLHIYDQQSNKVLITAAEDKTVAEILSKNFPHLDQQSISIEARFEGFERKVIKRTNTILSICKIKYLSRSDFTLHIIDINHYIDIYFNESTRHILDIKIVAQRVHCTKNTTVKEIEHFLSNAYPCQQILGLFGFEKGTNDNLVFKLKPHDHVLDLKAVFKHKNFFQYQVFSIQDVGYNSLKEFTGLFYKLLEPTDMIWFKKLRSYKIYEKDLVQIEGGKVRKRFYNLCTSNAQIVEVDGICILVIKNRMNEWILRGKRNKDVYALYNIIGSMKKQSLIDSHCHSTQSSIFESNHSVYTNFPENSKPLLKESNLHTDISFPSREQAERLIRNFNDKKNKSNLFVHNTKDFIMKKENGLVLSQKPGQTLSSQRDLNISITQNPTGHLKYSRRIDGMVYDDYDDMNDQDNINLADSCDEHSHKIRQKAKIRNYMNKSQNDKFFLHLCKNHSADKNCTLREKQKDENPTPITSYKKFCQTKTDSYVSIIEPSIDFDSDEIADKLSSSNLEQIKNVLVDQFEILSMYERDNVIQSTDSHVGYENSANSPEIPICENTSEKNMIFINDIGQISFIDINDSKITIPNQETKEEVGKG